MLITETRREAAQARMVSSITSSRPSNTHLWLTLLPERLPRKSRQYKARLVNLLVVISTQLLLFFWTPAPQRLPEIPLRIFAAYHEANLTTWVGGDSGVGVFDLGEDFEAGFPETADERQVEPLVLACTEDQHMLVILGYCS